MLIPQEAPCDWRVGQGGPRVSLAELRDQLTSPSRIPDGIRQRLLELAGRLARVQALGDEYARVSLSEDAAWALSGAASRA
jgi:hypothetical protein